MTITLAAVYAPVGIQGGLTGALFREFAFTLAGAVIVSGVVALTLSPMMGSKLLRAGDSERGFAGWINRSFDSVRASIHRALTSTLALSPRRTRVVVDRRGVDGSVLSCFRSGSWRRPKIRASSSRYSGGANSTIDQTMLFTEQVSTCTARFPETESIFQTDGSDGGFGGMVTKPWSQRKKTTEQFLLESMGPLSQIPGIRAIPQTPPPLPGGGDFPVDLVIASPGDPQRLLDLGNQLVQKAYASGHVSLCGFRSEIRSAPDRSRFRSRQAPFAGCGPQSGRPGSFDSCWW